MIVVTGGTGLVGSYLLLKLAREKSKVRVLIRPGSHPGKVFSVWKHYISDLKETFSKFEWYKVDLSNKAELYEALEGAEYIYHCAGKVSFDTRDKKEMWETNVLLTQRIVDFCLANSIKKLAYVSSVAAIAVVSGEKSTEQNGWPILKKSVYSKTKTLGEFEIWRGVAEGLNAVIVNPSVIIGPGNWKQSSARIFETAFKALKFYTKGATGFVDNRDVAEALIQLMKSDIQAERFILNAENMSFRELFACIASAYGKKPPTILIPPLISSIGWRVEWLLSRLRGKEARITKETARSAHRIQTYSSEKLEEMLNFRFRDLKESIRETAGCYLREKGS